MSRPCQITTRSRRRASLLDPAEYYPMASPRRGICVVINNMTYWHPKFQVSNAYFFIIFFKLIIKTRTN